MDTFILRGPTELVRSDGMIVMITFSVRFLGPVGPRGCASRASARTVGLECL